MPVEQTFTGRSTCSDGEISTKPPSSLTLLACPSGPKLLTPCAVTSVSRSLSIPAVKSHPVTQRLPPHNLTERTPASGLPNRCAVIETDCSRRKGRSSTCGALVTSLAHKAKSGSPSASSAAREGLPPTSRTRLAPRLAYQSSSLAVVTATPTERNARPNPSPRLGPGTPRYCRRQPGVPQQQRERHQPVWRQHSLLPVSRPGDTSRCCALFPARQRR